MIQPILEIRTKSNSVCAQIHKLSLLLWLVRIEILVPEFCNTSLIFLQTVYKANSHYSVFAGDIRSTQHQGRDHPAGHARVQAGRWESMGEHGQGQGREAR